MGPEAIFSVLLNPFCPLTTARILALRATILILLTLLIKAKIRLTAFSALGFLLLTLQMLMVLAISGGLAIVVGGALLVRAQKPRTVSA